MALPTRTDVDAMIRNRLEQDPDFRAALLADPHAALSELVGVPLPEAVNITVHEESLTDVHLVIPLVDSDGEVSESDLDLVSGAGCWDNCAYGV